MKIYIDKNRINNDIYIYYTTNKVIESHNYVLIQSDLYKSGASIKIFHCENCGVQLVMEQKVYDLNNKMFYFRNTDNNTNRYLCNELIIQNILC